MLNNVSEQSPSKTENRRERLPGRFVPQTVEQVDIVKLLDKLEELGEKARRLPGNILIGFDEEQYFNLVMKIRANLPDEIKKASRMAREGNRIVEEAQENALQQVENSKAEATRVLEDAKAESSHILSKAQTESERILNQARAEAARMIEQSEIQQMATAQAKSMLQRADQESQEIRHGADQYARDVLENLERVVDKALVTIRNGRGSLDRAISR
ncbi:MAG: hypothetical protein M1330_04670 [Armatimonadetes bacterium]|nr:hypothetical protein [Armatimonadota bacterium]